MELNYNIMHRLVSMTIMEISRLYSYSLDEAFKCFYTSKTAEFLEDPETLYFTYSPTSLAYLCLEENGICI